MFKAGAIIFNKKIVNCEICLHIVSIFCSTENIWVKGPLLTEYIKWRNVMYIFFLFQVNFELLFFNCTTVTVSPSLNHRRLNWTTLSQCFCFVVSLFWRSYDTLKTVNTKHHSEFYLEIMFCQLIQVSVKEQI